MPSADVVDLSRLQFAVTALYHFLFVPLTLGLSWILVIMESVYVMTGKEIYRDMTKFWGKLFGINFAMGVTTGITMEFQFGTNWAYFSHYVGDIFGAPLALEGLMAFFMESTFVGLFFFGWDRLGKVTHLLVTFLVALGSNLSALWILIANAWMQNPVGAEFNVDTMRMELTSFAELLFNPVAGPKFVHTLAAGYVAASMFVLGISSYYLLRLRDPSFAVRSFAVAAGFGLASALSVIVLGDESGYTSRRGAEGEARGDRSRMGDARTAGVVHGIRLPRPGGGEDALRAQDSLPDGSDRDTLGRHAGHGHPGTEAPARGAHPQRHAGVRRAAAAEIGRPFGGGESRVRPAEGGSGLRPPAEASTRPRSSTRRPRRSRRPSTTRFPTSRRSSGRSGSWSGLGLWFLFVFGAAFIVLARRRLARNRWVMQLALWSIPLPWIAAELGWIVAEYGRQPWTISEVLPTHLSVSSVTTGQIWFSLGGFIAFYTALLIVELYLMFKYARLGPSSLGTGRYHDESGSGPPSLQGTA